MRCKPDETQTNVKMKIKMKGSRRANGKKEYQHLVLGFHKLTILLLFTMSTDRIGMRCIKLCECITADHVSFTYSAG